MSYRINRRQDRQLRNLDRRISKINREVEQKYLNTFVAAPFSPGASGTTGALLNAVAPGVGPYGRVGNRIQQTSVRISGYIISNSAASSSRIVRCILVWWNGPYSGIPPLTGDTSSGSTAVLDTDGFVSGGVTLIPLLFAPYSKEYAGQYKVLLDRTWTINPGDFISAGASQSTSHPFDIKVPLSRTTVFDSESTTPTILDIAQNSLVLYWIVDNVNTNVTVNFMSRLYYKDT